MPSKKPSGAEYRKRRKIAEEQRQKCANNINSWLILHKRTASQTDHFGRFITEDENTEQSSGICESRVMTAYRSPQSNLITTGKQIEKEEGKSSELLESGGDVREDHKSSDQDLNLKECDASDEVQTSNRLKGFSDWKHLDQLVDHENTADHQDNFLKWKSLEKKIKSEKLIDDTLEREFLSEKQKWRHILKATLESILFCAKSNLPLRGTKEIIGRPDAGIFLSLLELISHYDSDVKNVMNHQKGTVHYLSPKIKSEFLDLLGENVRCEIISRIKEAKYFSLLFHCTPDVLHHKQVSRIIRYVHIDAGNISIEESFIDFIETNQKTGIGIADEIMSKLKLDGIDIKNARGQGYDNGANMSDIYNCIQAVILKENELVKFVPYSGHSLNLACVHSASVSPSMISFFVLVQEIYSFFASSTSRWTMLMSVLKTTLKGHSDTCWSSQANAVQVLHKQIKEVHEVLNGIISNTSMHNVETVSTATDILMQINYNFLCTLSIWNDILSNVDKITKALQDKNLSVLQASRMIYGLKNALQDIRENQLELHIEKAKVMAENMEISSEFLEKHKQKVKQTHFCASQDEGCSLSAEQLYKAEIKKALAAILFQLNWRYEKLNEVSTDFEFLSGSKLFSMHSTDLKAKAVQLAEKYSNDLNPADFSSEIESFKYQALSILPVPESATTLDLLKIIHEYEIKECYPNLETAMRIFLTLPVTVASCERSFSKLKLIKIYLRSSLAKENLSNMAILSIENQITNQINFDQIIDYFTTSKSQS